MFWFLSIICAVASTIFLGSGSAVALIIRRTSLKEFINENVEEFKANEWLKYQDHIFHHSKRGFHRRFLTSILLLLPMRHDEMKSVMQHHHLNSQTSLDSEGTQSSGYSAELHLAHADSSLKTTVVYSLFSLACSVIALLAGLMVFIWAEHSLLVSTTSTAMLAILFLLWFYEELSRQALYNILVRHMLREKGAKTGDYKV